MGNSNIPVGRFYTVVVVLIVLSVLFGWLCYSFGKTSGQKDCAIDNLEAVTNQQHNDNRVMYEETDRFTSMSASEYLLQ